MVGFQPLTCFCSMSFSTRWAEQIFDRISIICARVGLQAVPGSRKYRAGVVVKAKVKDCIDESLLVTVEADEISWWVAFELFYAVERKICIPLALEVSPDPHLPAEGLASVLPELDQIRYQDAGGGTRSLESQLTDALHDVLKTAAAWSELVRDASLDAYAPPRPRRVVPAYVLAEGTGTMSWPELFRSWLEKRDAPLCAAVLGSPGSGKTLLLAEFARSSGVSPRSHPQHASKLDPVHIFVRATALADAGDLLEFVREKVFEWESTLKTTRQRARYSLDHPGFFEPYRLAGMIYLLVDGLDELIGRNELHPLLNKVSSLGRHGIHVVISCRETLWMQQIRLTADYQMVRISSFDDRQAEELLDGVAIPPSAYDEQKRLKAWLRNPLLLGFILDLGKRAARPVSFDSRTELYEAWAREALGAEAASIMHISAESWLSLCGLLALALVGARKTSLSIREIPPLVGLVCPGVSIRAEHFTSTGVLRMKEGSQEIEFVHESIYEFFVARALASDFRAAIDPAISDGSLGILALADVELDFIQSAVYGFLGEMLGAQFRENLRARLPELRVPNESWKLLRNMIEYLGMTHEGEGNDRCVALCLLTIAENSELRDRIRYNALRALERAHPCAPRPYFAHVSDWGGLDYPQLEEIAKQPQETRPWVMQGLRKEKPVPGHHWAWLPNSGPIPDLNLQSEVSNRIGRLLRHLINTAAGEGLPINASHAWIRWFHESDRALLQELSNTARALPHVATYENLTRFVDKSLAAS